MSQELTNALSDCQLSWKPDSLSFMANRVAAQDLPETWCSAFPVLSPSGAPLWFERTEAMPCLGVLLTPTGDTLLAMEHRFTAGLHHQYARQHQLACRGIPKCLRLSRFYSTVASSILWGSGGWTLTAALVSRLESLELSLLRRTLAPPREPDEGFLDYMHRSAGYCRRLLVNKKFQGLAASALCRLHGWAGHVARLPPESLMRRVVNFKSLSWWRQLQAVGHTLDPTNRTGWRHPRPGRFVHWETSFELFDPNWMELA